MIGERKMSEALSEEFVTKVSTISHNKKSLIELMNQLDQEKRQIRSFMRQYSNEPKEDRGLSGSDRYKQLRRMKDRLSFMVEEREYVRKKLGDLKAEQKLLNRVTERKIEFCHAFMAAAEKLLSEEQFVEIEAKAANMLLMQKTNAA